MALLKSSTSPQLFKVGTGHSVLIVHGGPGFDHRYLFEPFTRISDKWQFVFYDQAMLSVNHDNQSDISLTASATQLATVVEHLATDRSIGLIAHSWGTLILASAFALEPEIMRRNVSGGILINPVPLTLKKFLAAQNQFLESLPDELLVKLQSTMAGIGDAEKSFAELLTYYVCDKNILSDINIHFDLRTYSAMLGSLHEFDFTPALGMFSNFGCMRGSKDIIAYDFIKELHEACHELSIVPDTGHFPTHERPEFVMSIIDRMLGQYLSKRGHTNLRP